jgi:dTDP-4-dehydrorhamnose 3,5-epimerase
VDVRPTAVDGCHELRLDPQIDRRGEFRKLFHASTFSERGMPFAVRELFWSRSHVGVVRGLHFQAPPADVAKLVCCLEGAVLDAVVDLRVGSATYRKHATVELSAARANAVFVPEGCAHGFLVTEGEALVLYAQSGEWDGQREGGVLWSSAGIDWPISPERAVLSDRDASFPTLDAFESPFAAPLPHRR